MPANKCSIQNKHNIPFWIRVTFLWGNAVCCFAGTISKQNIKKSLKNSVAPCPLKECSVHFQMSNPSDQRSNTPLEKSIFLHNICSIIDIEHPFQKCNMFGTVSIIKECSFASYHRTTEYCPVWPKKYSCEEAAFLENWITFVWHVYSSPRS